MKVLITGGAGFIGSHITRLLQHQPCQVTVLDNLSTGLRENIPDNTRFIEMDIRSPQLLAIFQQEQFDAVIHLAAQTMVHASLENPSYDCDINLAGMINVLEACRHTGVKRIIFSSTAAVYGDVNQLPIQENALTQPSSFYGLSKLTGEQYLALYHKIYGLEYIALRYANVYGERQGAGGEGGVISIFAQKIHGDETLQIFGDGEQTRDFIYAGDVAAANCQALQTPNANRVYNISTGGETSVNTLIQYMEAAAGKTVSKVYHPVREGDIYKSCLSNDAALRLLNWQPAASLKEGLEKTYSSLV